MFSLKNIIILLVIILFIIKNFIINEYPRINLLNNNIIWIQGKITKKSIDETILKIRNLNDSDINIIINSNGGDFIAGMNLITYILGNKKKILCYALTAKSTAFNIFQYCNKRFVTPNSVLFQHNITIEMSGSFEDFENFYENYFDFYRSINNKINKNIAKKIKLSYKNYINKVINNWIIIGGEEIIKNNLADKIIIINNLEFLDKK